MFYSASDIAKIMCRSTSFGYRVIRNLNSELKKMGYMVVHGRVPSDYFNERFNVTKKDPKN